MASGQFSWMGASRIVCISRFNHTLFTNKNVTLKDSVVRRQPLSGLRNPRGETWSVSTNGSDEIPEWLANDKSAMTPKNRLDQVKATSIDVIFWP